MTSLHRYTLLSTLLLIGLYFLFATSIQSTHSQATFDCSAVTIPEEECQSLVDLYELTEGASWIDSTNWLETDPCQEWFGVICVEDSVGFVLLPDNDLSGSLENWSPTLDNLFVLVVSGNNISGEIPASIGELPLLGTFSADENNFSGTLPETFGGGSVVNLSVSGNNQLTGEVPASFTDTTWDLFDIEDTDVCQPTDLFLSGVILGEQCSDERISPSCDSNWNLLDVVMIKQFDALAIQNADDCATVSNNEYIHIIDCDLNGDDSCGLVDAVIIQQCNAFINNPFCSEIQ